MGIMNLLGMRETAGDDEALRWHLQYNIFPAGEGRRLEYFDTCKIAIDLARNGDMGAAMLLPTATTPGAETDNRDVTVEQVVEIFFLDGFLVVDAECDEPELQACCV